MLALEACGSTPGRKTGPLLEGSDSHRVDTLLIRRLASDVAAGSDVVAAWEEVEALRQELRHKDAELGSALEALAAAQQYGESPRAVQRHQETAGQQLARFLKDQLALRDRQLAGAQAQAADLRQQLAASEQRQGAAEAEAEGLRRQQAGLEQELLAARGERAVQRCKQSAQSCCSIGWGRGGCTLTLRQPSAAAHPSPPSPSPSSAPCPLPLLPYSLLLPLPCSPG